MKNKGVQSIGIRLPIVKQGDDLKTIVVNAVLDSVKECILDATNISNGHDIITYNIQDKDVIGITESIVARAQGNYVTVDDIVQFLTEKNLTKNLILYSPIMSRNRFSMILKAFARYADKITIVYDGKFDEQGNPNEGINPFTGVNIRDYYKELCEKENCQFLMFNLKDCPLDDAFFLHDGKWYGVRFGETFIDCRCHPVKSDAITLRNILCTPVTRKDGSKSGYNPEYGLLGCNKATEEKIKLFPNSFKARVLIESIKGEIFNKTGKHVEVMVYGDGCFKDPIGGIWEFADPVTSPAYTVGLEGTPNEIKIKAFADDKFKDLSGSELTEAVKSEIRNKESNLIGNMASQGTTPRRYVDLLASLMDLTSGSGDKGIPVVLVKNYFCKYSD